MKYILIALLLLSFNASAADTTELTVERVRSYVGGGCKMHVLIDDNEIAILKNGKTSTVIVESGKRLFTAYLKCPLQKSMSPYKQEIELIPNDKKVVTINTSYMFGRIDAESKSIL